MRLGFWSTRGCRHPRSRTKRTFRRSSAHGYLDSQFCGLQKGTDGTLVLLFDQLQGDVLLMRRRTQRHSPIGALYPFAVLAFTGEGIEPLRLVFALGHF